MFLDLSGTEMFCTSEMDNLLEIWVKICKNQYFLLTPVLKATVLFESKEFEQVTICISILKIC